jgi:rod shape-determining protein MreD
MNRTLIYLAMGGVGIILQTVLLPLIITADHKPDLLLILVVYLGLHEGTWRGGSLVYLLGWFYDSVAGAFPGLHGFVLLGIFLSVRGIVTRVNTESSPLLLLLVVVGTILHSLLTAFALDFFSHTARIWPQMVWQLPVQLLLNFVAALVLLRITVWLQRTFMPRKDLPGLRKLDSRYES